MVTLEKIPENEDQELPKKPEIQSEITNFFQKKNIKCLFSGSMFQKIKAFLPKSITYTNRDIIIYAKRVSLIEYVPQFGMSLLYHSIYHYLNT